MICPHCDYELSCSGEYGTGKHESFYGNSAIGIHYPSTWERIGDMYRCENEDCDYWDVTFYTDERGNLHEGCPV